MSVDAVERRIVDAQLELLRLTVRVTCHSLNNLLTEASLTLGSKPQSSKDDREGFTRSKIVIDDMTRAVQSLHRLAFGGDTKNLEVPVYDLRDDIIRLVRAAKKSAPVIESRSEGNWAEAVLVRPSNVRLIAVELALGALELAPTEKVILSIEPTMDGRRALVMTAAVESSAWAVHPRTRVAEEVARNEGFEIATRAGDKKIARLILLPASV